MNIVKRTSNKLSLRKKNFGTIIKFFAVERIALFFGLICIPSLRFSSLECK
jgi:hypothetical protein